MAFQIQTSFSNHKAPGIGDHGVEHVRAVEALGGIAKRITDPKELASALQKARALGREHRPHVPISGSCNRYLPICYRSIAWRLYGPGEMARNSLRLAQVVHAQFPKQCQDLLWLGAILLYEFGKVFFDDVGVVNPGHTPFVWYSPFSCIRI
jgi:hypothetical protein